MAGHGTREVAVGSLVALAVSVGTAARGAQEQPPPTFRSEINFVQIPVRVLDEQGNFVRGLTQADFTLLEDGAPQSVASFTAVDLPFVRQGAARVEPEAELAEGDVVASNEAFDVDGRVYVFVLDNQTMGAATALRTRQLMRRFFRERLASNDLAAMVFTGAGRGQPFTSNPRLLEAALDRFMSDADPTDNNQFDRVMRMIAETAEWMGAIRGRQKALVLVTGSAICSLTSSDCRESADHALRTSVRSDVAIYTIDPAGLNGYARTRAEVANPNSSYGENGYREAPNGAAARAAFGEMQSDFHGPFSAAKYLADESGGFAVVNSNSLLNGFARLVGENTSYYLLGYYSSNSRANGQFRRNTITVSRDGLRVLYRSGYLAPRDNANAKFGRRNPTVSLDEQMQELADNPLPVNGIALRLAAAPRRSTMGDRRSTMADGRSTMAGKRSTVSVVVETPSAAAKKIRLSIGFYNPDGISVAGDDPTTDGGRYVTSVAVPPGKYWLWVGALESPSGDRGSLLTEIEVPDFSEPRLAISGITIASDDGMPVARRVFGRGDDVLLNCEVYGSRSDVIPTVTVSSATGGTMFRTALEPRLGTPSWSARIPLQQLGAGSFIATIEARSSSKKRPTSRSIRFAVQ